MPEAMEFLGNEDFHKLPLKDRFEVLRKDPNFSSLNPKDQGEIVYKAQQKFAGGQPTVNKPEDAGFFSTLGKDISSIPGSLAATGTGEKNDTRPLGIVPAMGRASHEQFQQGKEDFNKGEYLSGSGHYLAGSIPGIGPLAATAGEEIGSGQYGQGGAHAVEALAPFLFKGALETPIGKRISSAAKVAAPDLAKGGLKTAGGLATGTALKAMGVPGSDFSTALLTRPGLRQVGKGLVEGAKELVNYGKTKPPEGIVAPPGKGPSIGQLKTAVKNGTITIDQFNSAVDKMTDLNPEAKELHKADAVSSLKPDKSLGPVESPKTLNIGQLERLVKIGRIEPEEFNTRLITELKYKPEDAEHLTELLKQSIEDEESDEGEGIKKTENPKPKKPSGGIGEVKSPKANPKLKSSLEKQVIEPNLTAPEEFKGEFIPPNRPGFSVNPPGHEISPEFSQTIPIDFSKIDTTFRPDSTEVYDPQQFQNKYNPIDKSKTIDNFQGKTFDVQPQPDDFKESLVNELSGKVPERASITEQQIEESQSTARAAKETTLARHFADKTKFPELPKESEGTAEYLRAVGKDAGLKREPSRRTFENALKRAKEMREFQK